MIFSSLYSVEYPISISSTFVKFSSSGFDDGNN